MKVDPARQHAYLPFTFMISRATLLTLAASLCLASCGPARGPSAPAPAASASAVVADAELRDVSWARFVSKRFDLEIPFPDGKAWRIDDHGSNWLVATHPSSSTSLRVRIWHELELVSRERCEQRAREWSPDLPVLADARVIDDNALPAVPAPGFDTRVVAGFFRPKDPDALDGFVLAFGASGKKCFAFAWQTRARGTQAAERVGDRLGLGARMLEGSFIKSDLAPSRVPAPAAPQR